jgi:uncharacterized membrane protein YfcA
MSFLSVLFGSIVGLSLGLTGGGGAIFAVPLLVYGLHVPAREAVAISLAAVGTTALFGFVHRWKRGEVETRTGLIFALAGMAGAPLGAWTATLLPDALLMLLFAALMVVVAIRLWRQASQTTVRREPVDSSAPAATCQRTTSGALILNSPCAILLLSIGVLTGILSGLFGIGGGFVIVPALILYSGMPIHRAVGTSLLVVALVSVSGVSSQLLAGRSISPAITLLFIAGGLSGLFVGQRVGRRLSGPALQKVFVAAIMAVAAFVVFRNLSA